MLICLGENRVTYFFLEGYAQEPYVVTLFGWNEYRTTTEFIHILYTKLFGDLQEILTLQSLVATLLYKNSNEIPISRYSPEK